MYSCTFEIINGDKAPTDAIIVCGTDDGILAELFYTIVKTPTRIRRHAIIETYPSGIRYKQSVDKYNDWIKRSVPVEIEAIV